MLVAGEDGAVEGVSVGYSAVGLSQLLVLFAP